MQITKEYSKALVELNETLKIFSAEELKILPANLLKNLRQNMDKDYKWTYDNSKSIVDQNYMKETKALIIDIYKNYIAPPEEKEKWEKYDKICLNYIEEERRKKYNPDDLFKKHEVSNSMKENSNLPVKIEKESFISKVINKIKEIWNRKKYKNKQ